MGSSAVLFLVVLLVASPLAAAGWGGKGSYEPDTDLDRNGGWMFEGPDASPTGESIYFNGFASVGLTSLNPNAQVSRLAVASPYLQVHALFGVWKDCNRDGYFGLLEHGLMDYRSEVLAATALLGGPGLTICPVSSTPVDPVTRAPPADWFPSHNDGHWVREYLPFVHGTPHWFDIEARETSAWFDWGLPGAPTVTAGDCYLNPHPPGSLRTTGGMLGMVDCQTRWRIVDGINAVASLSPALAPYGFHDAPRSPGTSNSALNKPNPWGNEGDASYAKVWDCDRPAAQTIKLSNRNYVNVSQPKIPPGPLTPTGSLAGTMNETGSGTDQCHRHDAPPQTWPGLGGAPVGLLVTFGNQYHLGNDLANLPYGNEGGTAVYAKMRPDAVLGPSLGEGYDARVANAATLALGAPMPYDAGTRVATSEGIWGAGNGAANIYVDALGPAVNGVTYATYYAHVGASVLAKYPQLVLPQMAPPGLPAPSGSYGIEACGTATSGAPKGWNCDPQGWAVRPEAAVQVFMRRSYELRDVDCYDTSFEQAREKNVHWGVLTGTACA